MSYIPKRNSKQKCVYQESNYQVRANSKQQLTICMNGYIVSVLKKSLI